MYDNFLEPYFEWIDLIFYAIFPFIVMVLCTIFIVKVLYKSNRHAEKTKRLSVISLERTSLSCDKSKALISIKKRANRKKNVTYTLILLNMLFICLVAPLVISLAFLSGVENIKQNKILLNTVYLLAYSNHCFNFVFYGISSPPYRKRVLSIIYFFSFQK